MSKSPRLAALLTVFFPGLGHFYCGSPMRGVGVVVGIYFTASLLTAVHYIVALAALPVLIGLAARDAWHCAQAAVDEESKRLAAAVPPRLWVLGLWAACRAVWITAFPILGGAGLLIGAAYDLRHGRPVAGLVSGALACPLLALAWLAGDETWNTVDGSKPGVEKDMLSEIGATAAVGGIVVLLITIAAPAYTGLFRASAEGAMKGGLVTLREGVERYRKEHDGRAPDSLEALVQAKTIAELPPLWPMGSESVHAKTTASLVVDGAAATDSGQWAYVVSPSSPGAVGAVFIDCTHTDRKGSAWTEY